MVVPGMIRFAHAPINNLRDRAAIPAGFVDDSVALNASSINKLLHAQILSRWKRWSGREGFEPLLPNRNW